MTISASSNSFFFPILLKLCCLYVHEYMWPSTWVCLAYQWHFQRKRTSSINQVPTTPLSGLVGTFLELVHSICGALLCKTFPLCAKDSVPYSHLSTPALTVFLPLISQWSLSCWKRGWGRDVPYRDECSAVSYSLHLGQV